MIKNQKDPSRMLPDVRDELIRRFSEGSAASKYIATHWHRYRYDLRRIIPMLPDDGSVLDLGAYPFCVPETLSRLGYKVVGAGLELEHGPLGLSFETIGVNCDRAMLPFEDNRFDAVIFSEIFEHLYVDPLRAIEEIHRILKPGGFVYLTTPNAISLRRMARLAMRGTLADDAYSILTEIHAGGMIGHFREYTPREISRILSMSGFKEVKTRTVNPYRKQMVETWFWRAISAPFPKGREVIVSIGTK